MTKHMCIILKLQIFRRNETKCQKERGSWKQQAKMHQWANHSKWYSLYFFIFYVDTFDSYVKFYVQLLQVYTWIAPIHKWMYQFHVTSTQTTTSHEHQLYLLNFKETYIQTIESYQQRAKQLKRHIHSNNCIQSQQWATQTY